MNENDFTEKLVTILNDEKNKKIKKLFLEGLNFQGDKNVIFDNSTSEHEKNTDPKPDIKLYCNEKLVGIIEVKIHDNTELTQDQKTNAYIKYLHKEEILESDIEKSFFFIVPEKYSQDPIAEDDEIINYTLDNKPYKIPIIRWNKLKHFITEISEYSEYNELSELLDNIDDIRVLGKELFDEAFCDVEKKVAEISEKII